MKTKRYVLDYGFVQLQDAMGNDLSIVNAARQSFDVRHEALEQKDLGLIHFLMRDHHGSPFEMPVFTFNVKCPIFVAREWMRHRICSYNEYSGRYSKMLEDYYTPDLNQMRTQTGKPGAYIFEPMPEVEAVRCRKMLQASCETAWNSYTALLDSGVAKEVARMVLPVNWYTKFTWTVNLRSLFNFISLRSHKTAMWEIQQYSKQLEMLIEPIVPVAFAAFETHGRVAP